MKRYYERIYKDKEEWLSNRKIGGSSASAIMGCNKWMSKLDLWKAIIYPNIKKIDKENESMQYGIKCEPIIRELFATDFKDKFEVVRPDIYSIYYSKDYDFMSASLDGILTDKNTKEKYVLEIKTCDIRSYRDLQEWEGHLPQNYFIQICHYLLVMDDFKGAILCAKLRFFNKGEVERQEIRYYKVMRNEIQDSLDNLLRAEENFWKNNIIMKKMPAIEFKL